MNLDSDTVLIYANSSKITIYVSLSASSEFINIFWVYRGIQMFYSFQMESLFRRKYFIARKEQCTDFTESHRAMDNWKVKQGCHIAIL